MNNKIISRILLYLHTFSLILIRTKGFLNQIQNERYQYFETSCSRSIGASQTFLKADKKTSISERLQTQSFEEFEDAWRKINNWSHNLDSKGSDIVLSRAKTIPGIIADFWRCVHQCHEGMQVAAHHHRTLQSTNILFVAPACNRMDSPVFSRIFTRFLAQSCQDMSPSEELEFELMHFHPLQAVDKAGSKASGLDSGTAGGVSKAEAELPVRGPAPYPTVKMNMQLWPKWECPVPYGGNNATTRSQAKITEIQSKLERAYNSPAAAAPKQSLLARLLRRDKSSIRRTRPQDRDMPPTSMQVLNVVSRWMEQKLAQEKKKRASSQRLVNLQSVIHSSVSTSDSAPTVIADIFAELEFILLRANGVGCDKSDRKRVLPVSPCVVGDGFVDDFELPDPCFSSLVIFPNFFSFNAPAFRQFVTSLARLIQAAPLNEQFHIEMFHPELVTRNGKLDSDRQMPFPAIHIYYNGLKQRKPASNGTLKENGKPGNRSSDDAHVHRDFLDFLGFEDIEHLSENPPDM